ncbi:cell division protein FtsL [Planktotalea arctica]|uniref:cell division protein FtsL n=1 Tax=Planktotalea arctica TaxID=1481893 RepID=UPI000A174AF3|nr:cell division protein FtsL [Planktotalea arctica]
MRSLLYIITALAVIGLAFWAYRENYQTQSEIARTEKINRDIGDARARLTVLRAEWAYLNRPDRLRDLTEINFERLGLLPLRADQFGKVDQVAFPPEPEPELIITNTVDVSGMNMGEDVVTRGDGVFP